MHKDGALEVRRFNDRIMDNTSEIEFGRTISNGHVLLPLLRTAGGTHTRGKRGIVMYENCTKPQLLSRKIDTLSQKTSTVTQDWITRAAIKYMEDIALENGMRKEGL